MDDESDEEEGPPLRPPALPRPCNASPALCLVLVLALMALITMASRRAMKHIEGIHEASAEVSLYNLQQQGSWASASSWERFPKITWDWPHAVGHEGLFLFRVSRNESRRGESSREK